MVVYIEKKRNTRGCNSNQNKTQPPIIFLTKDAQTPPCQLSTTHNFIFSNSIQKTTKKKELVSHSSFSLLSSFITRLYYISPNTIPPKKPNVSFIIIINHHLPSSILYPLLL